MIYKIVMLLLIVVASPLQETKNSYFLESWKKGKEKIEEKQFNVELDPKNPKHEFTIKNKQGQPKYRLIINAVITPNYNKP